MRTLRFFMLRRRQLAWIKTIVVAMGVSSLVLGMTGCDFNLQAIILSPASGMIEISTGETVVFDGAAVGGIPFSSAASTSADGTTTPSTTEPYGFSWNTDGNPPGENGSTASESVDVLFETEGTFYVSLTVTDGEGATDTTTVKVVVKEKAVDPLRAVIQSPALSSIVVHIAAVTDDDGNITTEKVSNEVTFLGTGIDGSPFTVDVDATVAPYGYFWDIFSLPGVKIISSETDGSRVTVTFSKTGVFTVSFTVKDSRGVIDTASMEVTVVSDN